MIEDFMNREEVKIFIEKNNTIPNLSIEELEIIMNIFFNNWKKDKELLLLKIGELIINWKRKEFFY